WRPTRGRGRQAPFTDPGEEGVGGDTTDTALPLLDARSLAAFAGKPMSVLLTAPVDDAGELTMRAKSLLREAGWFLRCEGEADLARLQGVLRVGTVVQVEGVGSLHSGKYFVWSVRHTITAQSHRMKFVLVRNAMGPPPSAAGGGLLGGLLLHYPPLFPRGGGCFCLFPSPLWRGGVGGRGGGTGGSARKRGTGAETRPQTATRVG